MRAGARPELFPDDGARRRAADLLAKSLQGDKLSRYCCENEGRGAARTFSRRWCAPARGGSVGEITARRQTEPILCIMVEFVRGQVLSSSGFTPQCEQIFPQGF